MLRLMLLAGLGAAVTAQAAQPAPATSDFFAGESLGELTRYRVYPLVDRALRDNAAGRYASASALLQQALNIAPDSQAIRLALARTLMLQGRFGQVETILRPLDARSSSVAGLLLESLGCRRMTGQRCYVEVADGERLEAQVVGFPRVTMLSLTAIGRPSSGRAAPRRGRR